MTLSLTNNNIGCGPASFVTQVSNLPSGWALQNFPSCVAVAVTIVPDKWPGETTWEVRAVIVICIDYHKFS